VGSRRHSPAQSRSFQANPDGSADAADFFLQQQPFLRLQQLAGSGAVLRSGTNAAAWKAKNRHSSDALTPRLSPEFRATLIQFIPADYLGASV
jgi:hypothetical protein